MKQRIRVVGIVRNSDGVLVLKRSRGRSEVAVFWELPTGKILFGEQPEEAMARALSESVGLTVSSLKLKDVITFLALEGSSQLSNLYIIYEVQVAGDLKPDPRDRYTAYKFIKEPSGLKLSEATMMVFEIENGHFNTSKVSPRGVANSATVYVDGASRGNPGPAGVGYVVVSETGETLKQGGEFIGFATSRVAEYYALEEGMKVAIDLGVKSVRFVTDSLMVANQMNGIFQIKNQDILPIYEDVQKLLEDFEVVAFTHVPRSQNAAADREANLAIDQMLKN
jgi:ribonuclease HI